MKLLIVDDEKLTRDGLLSAINWNKFNIEEILMAENGLQGLRIAKEHRPEIILSDIRMPKLNGIEMAEQLQSIIPNSSIIFMSGYSDKQYLKSAIKLKAISYVEKPLDPAEIEDAIEEAIKENQFLTLTQTTVEMHNLAKTTQLALHLTYPTAANIHFLDKLFEELSISHLKSNYLTTLIVKFEDSLPTDYGDSVFNYILDSVSTIIEHEHLHEIHVVKHDNHLIYHLFHIRKSIDASLQKIAKYFTDAFRNYGNYFIIIGNTVHGYEHAFDSYSSAVILSQRTFFADYFSVLTESAHPSYIRNNTTELTAQFIDAIGNHTQPEALDVAQQLFEALKSSTLLPLQVKDMYYKLFMAIQTNYKKYQLNLQTIGTDADSILGYVEPCLTLMDLHVQLVDKTNHLFDDLKCHQPENPIIFSMKEYIAQHYCNDFLSVKDISDYVNLTASYGCTIFKSETGQTLNQYITEYRIEKAKDLLLDPRNKISDISSKVGYADGNYFGKSFKKIVGLSPSEFRERMSL